jgi:hypothetical protein
MEFLKRFIAISIIALAIFLYLPIDNGKAADTLDYAESRSVYACTWVNDVGVIFTAQALTVRVGYRYHYNYSGGNVVSKTVTSSSLTGIAQDGTIRPFPINLHLMYIDWYKNGGLIGHFISFTHPPSIIDPDDLIVSGENGTDLLFYGTDQNMYEEGNVWMYMPECIPASFSKTVINY